MTAAGALLALLVFGLIVGFAPVAQASPYTVEIRITGTSEVDCEFCEGTGRVDCILCVDGKVDCATCVDGRTDCYICVDGACGFCNGAGGETCILCGGTGEWMGKICDICGGDGCVECFSCGGTGECFYCDGLGYKTCAVCDGKGWKTCTICGGKGGEPCAHCDGKGTVGLSFRGSYGDLGGLRSVDGTVPATYTIVNPSGDTVSASFMKTEEAGTLTVEIVRDGVVVESKTTTAAYGMVVVAYSWIGEEIEEKVGVVIGAVFIAGIFWFIVAIILCVWVYRDAKARGENAALWLIIVLIAGIIGLIIWLIVRPKEKVAE